MSTSLGKIKFNFKKNDFDKLDKLVSNIIDCADTFDEEVEYLAGVDAANFAERLAENYKSYVERNTYDEKTNPDIKSLYEIKFTPNRAYGTPTIIANYNKGGFEVIMRGRDIVYQEYGTGDVGKEDAHPKADEIGWVYGSGPKVLRNGDYANSSYSEGPPQWYLTGIEKGTIDKSKAIWMSPHGATYGIGPGMFMYDTLEEYMSDNTNDDTSYRGSDMSQSLSGSRARNITTRVQAKINKGL